MKNGTRYFNHFLGEWLLLFCSLLMLGGFIAFSLFEEHQKIEIRERERLATQAKVIHDNLSRQLEGINRALLNVREDLPGWQRQKDGMVQASRRLKAFSEAITGVRTMTILDADGSILATSRPDIIIGSNFRERAYFQAALKNPHPDTFYISPPFQTSLGAWAINVVRMVPGAKGQFAGIVSATLDPEEFKILLESVLYAPDMRAALNHGDGAIFMTAPVREEVFGKSVLQPGSMYSQLLASGDTHDVFKGLMSSTDDERIAAVRMIRPPPLLMDKGLAIVVSRDLKALYQGWRQEAILLGSLFSVLLLITASGLHLMQRRRRSADLKAAEVEAALRAKSEELERFFDVSLDLMCIADFEGRFRKLNPAWEKTLGYSLADLEGRIFIDFVHPDDHEATIAATAQLAAGDRVVSFTNRYRTRSGKYRAIEWHSVPYEGRLIYAAARDVTERDERERLLQEATTAAKAANSAKSQFLANMSHEIRTPMNGVLGLLELLQLSPLSGRQMDYVQKAQTTARSLLVLLNDILDFSKIEAGKLELEQTRFNLDQIGHNLVALLSATVEKKQIDLRFDLAPDMPRTLIGDAFRLQQVLLNLAGNAVKFTEHGEVVISLRPLAVSPEQVQIEFAVRDTGIGIPADMREAIFDGFTQAEASTSRRFGGSGLGLSICQRLIRMMGGELAVESEPGRGSRFHFTLELQRAQSEDASPLPQVHHARGELPLAGLRLLIVEDNPTNQQVARELLSRKGAYVETASSGEEGLDLVKRTKVPFDAVLMDIQMPGMDGHETTRILRQTFSPQILPIIAITANAQPEERNACLASGMNDHVGKPIDFEQLTTVLLHHCPPTSAKNMESTPPEPVASGLPDTPPGFELSETLARLGDNCALYVDLLALFREDQAAITARIHQQLPAGDLTGAARELHTLKGLAATLGAQALADFSREAEALVKAGKDHAAIATLPGRLQAAVDETLATMNVLAEQFTAAQSNTKSPFNIIDVVANLDELDRLLTENNLRALDAFTALRQELGGAAEETIDEASAAIERAMAQMDFAEALAASRTLRELLKP